MYSIRIRREIEEVVNSSYDDMINNVSSTGRKLDFLSFEIDRKLSKLHNDGHIYDYKLTIKEDLTINIILQTNRLSHFDEIVIDDLTKRKMRESKINEILDDI